MIVGIPKEIKSYENRVAITPAGVVLLTESGHQVLVEQEAGSGSGFSNEEYKSAGAHIVENAKDVWQSRI